MADSTSGNSEELKLKITPELDQAALKKAQEQLDGLKASPISSDKGRSGGGVTSAMKAETDFLKYKLSLLKEEQNIQDVALRKARIAANEKIELLRREGAAGKITMQQMNDAIIQQEQLIESTTNQSVRSYDELDQKLQDLKTTYAQIPGALGLIAKAELSVVHARQRAVTGFNSMSGSMQQMVSQTKNANLAFMNFGRIVQDAPFGLIGIANNIDPLLVSLSVLSNEIDVTTGKVRGFGGTLKALGSQLLGPAGIIFLLGSALPSILLVLQRRQQEATKESNAMAEALKKVADEFGRLAAEAAGEGGISQVNAELQVTNQTIDAINRKEAEILGQARLRAEEIAKQNGSLIDVETNEKLILAAIKLQNKELLNTLDADRKLLETNKQQLEDKANQLGFQERISKLQKEDGIAAALSLKEQISLQKELNDTKLKVLDILDPFAAEVQRERDRILEAMSTLNTKAFSIFEIDRIQKELQKAYDNAEQTVRDRQNKSNKKTEESAEDLLKRRMQFEDMYTKYIQVEFKNRLDAEKKSLDEILNSEFATLDQKLRAQRKYNENVEALFDEFRERARKKDEQDRQERLKKDLDARKEFVRQQALILDRRMAQDEAKMDLSLMAAENFGQDLNAIELRRLINQRNLQKQYGELGLLDSKEFIKAKESIDKASERDVALFKIEQQQLVAQAVGASFEAIFGENKSLASSIVIVDTIMGMQKALTSNADNIIKGVATAAMLAAQGAIALRKINSTKRGSNNLDSGASQTPTTREVMAVGIGPRAGQIISPYGTVMSASAQPQNMIAMPDISIDARVDRRGLAIAVREGEQEIRTQQFSYT